MTPSRMTNDYLRVYLWPKKNSGMSGVGCYLISVIVGVPILFLLGLPSLLCEILFGVAVIAPATWFLFLWIYTRRRFLAHCEQWARFESVARAVQEEWDSNLSPKECNRLLDRIPIEPPCHRLRTEPNDPFTWTIDRKDNPGETARFLAYRVFTNALDARLANLSIGCQDPPSASDLNGVIRVEPLDDVRVEMDFSVSVVGRVLSLTSTVRVLTYEDRDLPAWEQNRLNELSNRRIQAEENTWMAGEPDILSHRLLGPEYGHTTVLTRTAAIKIGYGRDWTCEHSSKKTHRIAAHKQALEQVIADAAREISL